MCGTEIVFYPEKILRQKAIDVKDFADETVQNTIARLWQIMDTHGHCVGLAANQIGSNLNIFVADASKNLKCKSKYGRVVLINPKLESTEGLEKLREGCMSVPDFTGDVTRAVCVEISGVNQDGQAVTLQACDFEARVFQHEIDHLSGKVFLDRVASSREVHTRKNYRK